MSLNLFFLLLSASLSAISATTIAPIGTTTDGQKTNGGGDDKPGGGLIFLYILLAFGSTASIIYFIGACVRRKALSDVQQESLEVGLMDDVDGDDDNMIIFSAGETHDSQAKIDQQIEGLMEA
eukprot:m.1630937 g.1630937  ORF g.1630937 m.1630937 type:complete len:123 (+) comp25400_c0_seq3:230-598(+)